MNITKVKLSDICIGKGNYGIPASAVPFSEDLYTYLRITDINDDGTLNLADKKSVNDPKAKNYILKENDIVFARTGNSTGRSYFYDSRDGELVYAGFLIKFSLDHQKVNPLFIKYYAISEAYRGWIASFNTGSTRGNINAQTYANMEIPLPPRSQQDLTVDILSSLDSKIRWNTQINHNLEQQAQVLFERLLCSGNGETTLDSIALINPPRSLKKGCLARCIDMAQLSTSQSFPQLGTIKPYSGGMKFKNGDTIFARITPCLENGKTAYIDFLKEDEVAFGSTEYIVMSSRGGMPSPFFYCLARYKDFIEYATKRMNGSSGRQRVSADAIAAFPIPFFSGDAMCEFGKTALPVFNVIKNNSIENLRLAALRDTLLPRLMSGEIDVSEVEV